MKLMALLVLALCLHGCAGDPREAQLAAGLEAVRQKLLDPELAALARKQGGAGAAGRVAALFSAEGEHHYHELVRAVPRKIAVLRTADLPWSLVVVPQEDAVRLEAYAARLDRPWRAMNLPVGQ